MVSCSCCCLLIHYTSLLHLSQPLGKIKCFYSRPHAPRAKIHPRSCVSPVRHNPGRSALLSSTVSPCPRSMSSRGKVSCHSLPRCSTRGKCRRFRNLRLSLWGSYSLLVVIGYEYIIAEYISSCQVLAQKYLSKPLETLV